MSKQSKYLAAFIVIRNVLLEQDSIIMENSSSFVLKTSS
jgi:hypothetical protein